MHPFGLQHLVVASMESLRVPPFNAAYVVLCMSKLRWVFVVFGFRIENFTIWENGIAGGFQALTILEDVEPLPNRNWTRPDTR